MIRAAGFKRVTHDALSGNIAALHGGWKTVKSPGEVLLFSYARLDPRRFHPCTRGRAVSLADASSLPASARFLAIGAARLIERRARSERPAGSKN